jgi:hypothetical protein
MRMASSTGTALAVRMLKVRVKRAVLNPRTSRPNSGRRSWKRWKRRRLSGSLQPVDEAYDGQDDAMSRYMP